MAKIKMNKNELKWRAESDAETLARYQEIINDKSRMNLAVKEAQKKANDLSKRATSMLKASKTKGGK